MSGLAASVTAPEGFPGKRCSAPSPARPGVTRASRTGTARAAAATGTWLLLRAGDGRPRGRGCIPCYAGRGTLSRAGATSARAAGQGRPAVSAVPAAAGAGRGPPVGPCPAGGPGSPCAESEAGQACLVSGPGTGAPSLIPGASQAIIIAFSPAAL